MKRKVTLSNIKSFIDGNFKNIINKTIGLPEHIIEQYYYRLYLCKDSCLREGNCEVCNCPTMLKAFANKSCNPDKILDLMPGGEWRNYKKENNITEELLNEIKDIINGK